MHRLIAGMLAMLMIYTSLPTTALQVYAEETNQQEEITTDVVEETNTQISSSPEEEIQTENTWGLAEDNLEETVLEEATEDTLQTDMMDIQNVAADELITLTWDKQKGEICISYDETVKGEQGEITFKIDEHSDFRSRIRLNGDGELIEGKYKLYVPYKNYFVENGNYSIELVLDSGISKSSDIYEYVKPENGLAVPNNLSITKSGISWDSVSGATSYFVIIYRDSDEWSRLFDYEGNGFGENDDIWQEIQKDLEHYYSFEVQALSDDITTTANSSFVSSGRVYLGTNEPKGPKDLIWSDGTLSYTCQDEADSEYWFLFYRTDEDDTYQEGIGPAVRIPCKKDEKVEYPINHLFQFTSIYCVEVSLMRRTNRGYTTVTQWGYERTEEDSVYRQKVEVNEINRLQMSWPDWEQEPGKAFISWYPVEDADYYYIELFKDEEYFTSTTSDYVFNEEEGKFKLDISSILVDANDHTYSASIIAAKKGSLKECGPSTLSSLFDFRINISLLQFLNQEIKKLLVGQKDQTKLYITPANVDTYVDIWASVSSGDIPVTISGSNLSEGTSGEQVLVRGSVDIDIIANPVDKPVDVLITARESGGRETSTTYRIMPRSAVAELDKSGFDAITNIDKTLEDMCTNGEYKLAEGWEWYDAKQQLTSLSGTSILNALVVHKEENAEEVIKDNIPVRIFTLKGIEIQDSDTKGVLTGKYKVQDEVQIEAIPIWQGPTDQKPVRKDIGTKVELEVIQSNKFIELNQTETGYKMKALAKGNATIVASYQIGNNKITKSIPITVVEDKIEFRTSIHKDGEELAPENNIYKLESGLSDVTYSFVNESSGNYKLAYKVSDTSVLQIDKNGILNPLKAGNVLLTVTADDALKSMQTYLIKVVDNSVNSIALGQTAITFNKAADKAEVIIPVYDGNEGVVQESYMEQPAEGITVSKYDAHNIKVVANLENSNVFSIKKITVRILIKREGQSPVEKAFDVSVKWINQGPNLTITQEDKWDLAFPDSVTSFAVTSTSGNINGIWVENPYCNYGGYKNQCNFYVFSIPSNKKINVGIDVEGYQTVTKTITVKTQRTAFALASTSGIYYPELGNELVTSLYNKTKKINEWLILTNWDDETDKFVYLGEDATSQKYKLIDKGDGNIHLQLKNTYDSINKSGDKIKIFITQIGSQKLDKPLAFTYTVKCVEARNSSLELEEKNLILYNYANKVAQTSTTIALKGGYFDENMLEHIQMQESVNQNLGESYNKTLSVQLNKKTGQIQVQKISSNLKPGTYKYQFNLNTSGKNLATTLSIKVINVKEEDAKVSVSAKNTIDILDRENTYVKITPKFTNVAKDASISLRNELEGRDADLFEVVHYPDTGIRLKEGVSVSTKATYMVKVVYDIDSNGANITLTSDDIKIKLKPSKATAKITGNGSFGNKAETRPLEIVLTNSKKQVIDIENLELTNFKKDFKVQYNVVSEKWELIFNPTGETARGKSYTLKFNVYPEGASVNDKPIVVNYKINIVK